MEGWKLLRIGGNVDRIAGGVLAKRRAKNMSEKANMDTNKNVDLVGANAESASAVGTSAQTGLSMDATSSNFGRRKWLKFLMVCGIAAMGALNYEVFVFPNNFAPAGLNGFLTIIRHLTGVTLGSMSLVLNVPLLIAAFKVLKKNYAIYTTVYVLVFSITSIVLKNFEPFEFAFYAKDGGERILAAIAAGVFNGAFYSVQLRLGGSTGGMDIVASFINHKRPQYSLVWVIFIINCLVAAASFFAYGMDYVPVILCIVYSFVTTRVNDAILKGARSAAKFEVVTSRPEELAAELMTRLHHGCSVIRTTGMYSHKDRSLVICVVNNMQIADFERILAKFPDSFVMVSSVTRTYGNFKRVK